MAKFETSDNLLRYFKDVDSKYVVLTREQELSLAIRISEGDQSAMDELVTANLKFVVKIANGFIGLGASIDDLINAGNEGLIIAAKRFDPIRAKDNKFITYAQSWIRKMCHLEIDAVKVVKLPLNKEYEIYIKKKAGESSSLGKSVSIDKPLNSEEDSPTIGDTMSTTETNPINISHNQWLISQLTTNLSPNQKNIVSMAYGLDDNDQMTVKEIAHKLNVELNVIATTLRHAKKMMKEKAHRVSFTRTFKSSLSVGDKW